MPTQPERLAALETIAADVRDDIRQWNVEQERTRRRLHDLEKVTEGLVTLQKELHRANERQFRRVTLAIQWGGLAMGLGMFILALVTLLVQLHA